MIGRLSNALRQQGKDLYSGGSVTTLTEKLLSNGQKELRCKVYCNFGFVHHPTVRIVENSQTVVDYVCDCYEYSEKRNSEFRVCSHCAALLAAVFPEGDVTILQDKALGFGNLVIEESSEKSSGLRFSPASLRITEDFAASDGCRTIKAKAYCSFGFVHHPKVQVQGKDLREFGCDCYFSKENPGMCPHCEALAFRVLSRTEEMESEETVELETVEPEETVEPVEVEEVPAGPVRSIQLLMGYEEKSAEPVFWYPNDTSQLFHTNTGIIGTMGTGKTQFTKSMITQLCRQQKNNFDGSPLGILIFDYKGDYNESKPEFLEATNATVLKPYNLPFNPFALSDFKRKPQLPIHTANAFTDTIAKIYKLGPIQRSILLRCIRKAYDQFGITSDPTTWNRLAPTFDTVYNIYMEDDEIKKSDSLFAAMEKLAQFQILEAKPEKTESLYRLINGVVVIDLSGYDSDIQNLIVAITLELFYSQMQNSGSSKMNGQYRQLTKFILVDEADNFMSEGFPALKRILKEGREFGVGTILSTQFLKHFGTDEDDYSKYILTWVVHNVADLKKSDVEFVFKLGNRSGTQERLFHDIKALEKHHSIVKVGNSDPVYIEDKAFWTLAGDVEERYLIPPEMEAGLEEESDLPVPEELSEPDGKSPDTEN